MAEGGQGQHLVHLLFAGSRRATTSRRFTIYLSWPYLYPIQKQSIPHLHLRAHRRDSYLDANSSTVILSDLKLDIGDCTDMIAVYTQTQVWFTDRIQTGQWILPQSRVQIESWKMDTPYVFWTETDLPTHIYFTYDCRFYLYPNWIRSFSLSRSEWAVDALPWVGFSWQRKSLSPTLSYASSPISRVWAQAQAPGPWNYLLRFRCERTRNLRTAAHRYISDR